jgi:hypothetical protein
LSTSWNKASKESSSKLHFVDAKTIQYVKMKKRKRNFHFFCIRCIAFWTWLFGIIETFCVCNCIWILFRHNMKHTPLFCSLTFHAMLKLLIMCYYPLIVWTPKHTRFDYASTVVNCIKSQIVLDEFFVSQQLVFKCAPSGWYIGTEERTPKRVKKGFGL